MLTYEAVLKVFADYLKEDTDYEVVLTAHGYTVMGWDKYREDWNNVVHCPTRSAAECSAGFLRQLCGNEAGRR